jgi:hypothetical protein
VLLHGRSGPAYVEEDLGKAAVLIMCGGGMIRPPIVQEVEADIAAPVRKAFARGLVN